ncbi:FecR family protein [Rhizobium rhizophilum]|uniref:FecR family protein n=2 Tax=Rhizobium rhizophilum TaxID=1850373 RepID=A0ABY2QSC5_9HYPH|nr:FecR family protein [Rhizobium rhizophilum]
MPAGRHRPYRTGKRPPVTMPEQAEDERALLLDEAMDWFMRLRDAPAEPELFRQWEAWLQTSDAHAAAWTRICRSWAALGERTACPPASTRAVHRAGMLPRRVSRRGLGLATAALLCAGLTAAIFGPFLQTRLEADFHTGAGQTQVVMLADGSRVTLAPQTALAEDFDSQSRQVRLLAGEAFFEVERDATRPFVVAARDASVRVLGTAFGVRDTGQGTRVELAHGAITLTLGRATGGQEIALAPGDVVTVDRRLGRAERSQVDPAEIALWREGSLSVTNQTFGDVVSLIQRQSHAWIVVADSTISSLRVTGLYDLHDPDKALDALAAPFDLKVRTLSPYLRVISKD